MFALRRAPRLLERACRPLSSAMPTDITAATEAVLADLRALKTPKAIDMRSDTVTRPTVAMREAMRNAVVGDDVWGDDPTVHLLQDRAARLFRKEAALFVPSGTMGNLIAVLAHCWGRGEEVILGDQSHIFVYEQGGISALGGVHPRTVPNKPDGTMDLDEIRRAIRPVDDHAPTTRLIILENTHNRCGGPAITADYTNAVADIARQHNLKLHIDGARILNAAVALNVEPHVLVEQADSVSVCLSKGLGAPVGSLLLGSASFIARGRRLRKALGGGLRQSGTLAAAGLLALEAMRLRLVDDHANARRLASLLSALSQKGIRVDMNTVQSNIVIFRFERDDMTPEGLCERVAAEANVWIIPMGGKNVRAVVHHEIQESDIDTAAEAIRRVVEALPDVGAH